MLHTFARMHAVSRWETLPHATMVVWLYTTFAVPFTMTLILNIIHNYWFNVPEWALWVAIVWFTMNSMSIFVYYHIRECGCALENRSVAKTSVSAFHVAIMFVYLPIVFALQFMIVNCVTWNFGWVMYLQFGCLIVISWTWMFYCVFAWQHELYYQLRRSISRYS